MVKHRLPSLLLLPVLMLLLLLLAGASHAQLTPQPRSSVCYSNTQDYYSAAFTIHEQHQGLVQVNQLAVVGPTLVVECSDVQSSSVFGANLQACVNANTAVYICWTKRENNYSHVLGANSSQLRPFCSLAFPLSGPLQLGDINGPSLHWALFLSVTNVPAFCFPREVEVAILSRVKQTTRGSTLLMVVVGIILLMLVLCGCVFGGRGLKQRCLLLLRRGDEDALDLRPDPLSPSAAAAAVQAGNTKEPQGEATYYLWHGGGDARHAAGPAVSPPPLLLPEQHGHGLDTSTIRGPGSLNLSRGFRPPQDSHPGTPLQALQPFSGPSLYEVSLQQERRGISRGGGGGGGGGLAAFSRGGGILPEPPLPMSSGNTADDAAFSPTGHQRGGPHARAHLAAYTVIPYGAQPYDFEL